MVRFAVLMVAVACPAAALGVGSSEGARRRVAVETFSLLAEEAPTEGTAAAPLGSLDPERKVVSPDPPPGLELEAAVGASADAAPQDLSSNAPEGSVLTPVLAPAESKRAEAVGAASPASEGPGARVPEGTKPAREASVVASRAFAVELTGIGFTLVGVGTWIHGQLEMDAADRMPAGEARQARLDYGRSMRGGGVGAVVVGVAIWLIAGELSRWDEEAPATVGFAPVKDGGALTFGMRWP